MAFNSIQNGRSQSMDTIWLPDGTARVKLAVGTQGLSGQATDGAWQGVATHQDGGTFAAGDGVAVLAGLDGTTVRPVLVDGSGKVLISVAPASGNLTDHSGTIASGATAQSLMLSNVDRKYLFVLNLDAAEDLWINFGVTAVADEPSIRLQAGESFVMEAGFVSTQAVSIIGATTSHKFVAKEG